MEHAFRRAAELGHEVIVILGSPANYVSSGFQSCRKYNVCFAGGKFPAALLVKELKPGALDGGCGGTAPVMGRSAVAASAPAEPWHRVCAKIYMRKVF